MEVPRRFRTIEMAILLGNRSRLEVRAMIRFLWTKNVSASDIHSQIEEVYGEEAMRKQHAAKWYNTCHHCPDIQLSPFHVFTGSTPQHRPMNPTNHQLAKGLRHSKGRFGCHLPFDISSTHSMQLYISELLGNDNNNKEKFEIIRPRFGY
ncbi:hypothetical protein TNCV_691271 [Trichonephila clavipes]|nr:hypothetical protein TNCV_691271 [Trichonephila clavipes]